MFLYYIFTKKSFSFPFIKDKAGMFTGVKIGVMDRSGDERTTYRVPVEIRVGKRNAAEDPATPPADEAKSG